MQTCSSRNLKTTDTRGCEFEYTVCSEVGGFDGKGNGKRVRARLYIASVCGVEVRAKSLRNLQVEAGKIG